jgi:hypothetical protein
MTRSIRRRQPKRVHRRPESRPACGSPLRPSASPRRADPRAPARGRADSMPQSQPIGADRKPDISDGRPYCGIQLFARITSGIARVVDLTRATTSWPGGEVGMTLVAQRPDPRRGRRRRGGRPGAVFASGGERCPLHTGLPQNRRVRDRPAHTLPRVRSLPAIARHLALSRLRPPGVCKLPAIARHLALSRLRRPGVCKLPGIARHLALSRLRRPGVCKLPGIARHLALSRLRPPRVFKLPRLEPAAAGVSAPPSAGSPIRRLSGCGAS